MMAFFKKKPLLNLLVILSICVLVLPVDLFGQSRKGSHIIIEKLDGQEVTGELILIKENSLLVKRDNSQNEVPVYIEDVAEIKVHRRGNPVGKGMGIGFMVGIGVGALVLIGMSSLEEGGGDVGPMVILGLVVGGAFALAGGTVGGVKKKYITMQVRGKSPRKIKKILKKLKKYSLNR